MRPGPDWPAKAAAVVLVAIAAAPALGQSLVKKTYLSAMLAHELLTTAVETCTKRGEAVSGVVRRRRSSLFSCVRLTCR